MIKDYIIYSGSLENFIFDLISFLTIFSIIFFLYYREYLNKQWLVILICYSSTPFFFNDIIIKSTSLWDQYTNLSYALEARGNFFSLDPFFNYMNTTHGYRKLINTGTAYGLFPIFMSSINSIAFVNKFIVCMTAIYLIHKNYISKLSIFFLLLFPSTIIYSSVSLKAILIGFSSIWILIFLYEKKYIFLFILIFFVFSLRPQFYTLLIAFLIYYMVLIKIYKIKYLTLCLNIFILFWLVIFREKISLQINHLILLYNLEDTNWTIENLVTLNQFSFRLDDIIQNLKIIFSKLTLNWPVQLKYKIIFIIENLLIFFLIIFNFFTNLKKDKIKTLSILFFLLTVIFLFYSIFPNLLPLHRYMYPFLVFFIIFYQFDFRNKKIYYEIK
jgi:hypothetical protein